MLYVLNGVLPHAINDDGFVTPAGDIQALYTEREVALDHAKLWYAKGRKPVLFSKTYDGQFEFLYNYKNYDRAAKAKATKAAKKAA
jgi:hypothetical protein